MVKRQHRELEGEGGHRRSSDLGSTAETEWPAAEPAPALAQVGVPYRSRSSGPNLGRSPILLRSRACVTRSKDLMFQAWFLIHSGTSLPHWFCGINQWCPSSPALMKPFFF